MEDELEFDPGSRQLCPDGTCVGLVGPNGRCTVCGREGAAASARGPGPRSTLADADTSSDAADAISAGSEATGGANEEGFDAARKLCDDGACVGIVGADGRCLVCGRVSGS